MVQLTKENLIYIGASGTIAVAALALIGSSIFSGATTEGLEIASTSFKKASGDGVLTVSIKNVGTSEIEHLRVTLNGIELSHPTLTAMSGFILYDSAHRDPDGNINTIGADVPLTTTSTSRDITFDYKDQINSNDSINAGQTTSYSGTVTGSSGLNVGDSFVITVEGFIDGSVITNTAVVTVTRF